MDSQERQEIRKELDELQREFREELIKLDMGLSEEVVKMPNRLPTKRPKKHA